MQRVGTNALAALLMLWTSLACSPSAGAERVDALKSEPAASAASNEVALGFGRVVDEQGAPVAGATVELWHGGRLIGRAVSGADGKFEMRGLPPMRTGRMGAVLVARGPANSLALHEGVTLPLGRSGASLADLDPRGANWCELLLEPTHSLEVQVLGPAGSVTVTAATLGADNRVLLDIRRTVAPGAVRLTGLPDRLVQVFASDGRRGRCTTAQIPTESALELELEETQHAEVLIVDEKTCEPVSGAQVSAHKLTVSDVVFPGGALGPQVIQLPELTWHETATTDNAGVARFSGLEADTSYALGLNAPGYQWPVEPDITQGVFPRLVGGNERARYLVRPSDFCSRSLRMLTDPSEAPPNGSIVQIFDPESTGISEGDAPLALGRIEKGHLIAELPWPMDVRRLIARAPDGSFASLDVVDENSSGQRSVSPLRFGAPRAIDVRVLDASGKACSDLAVAMVCQPIMLATRWGNVVSFDLWSVYALTDLTGTARFQGLPPFGLVARVQHPDFPHYEMAVEPTTGNDDTLEVIWHPPFRAIATVTVDGHVGLPEGLAWAPFYPRAHLDEGRLLFELPVPDAGESTTIVASAPGLSIANASLKPTTDGSTVHFRLDLERGKEVTVLCPRFREVELVPERFDSEQNLWSPLVGTTSHVVTMNEQCTQRRIEGLRAGRWRMRDKRSGAVSTEVELGPDNRAGVVTLLGQ